MGRYKLSNNISVFKPDEVDEIELPIQFSSGYYILCNRRRDRHFLINETIKYFIDKFSTPKSTQDIIAEVAADVASSSENVNETCTSFIHHLKRRRIIIPESEKEAAVITEPLYTTGDLINQYRISNILSNKRSMDIYTATDLVTGGLRVIKLLNRNKLPDAKKYEQEAGYLEREFSLLKRLEGERDICQAVAFEKDALDNAYIVLELIEGRPVLRFMTETSGLTRGDVLLIIKNMLHAFARMHQRGTVHGDIHSGNVLVAADKSVKLIDLGLSINKEIEEKQVVKYGGVDYYMPPERINTTSAKKFSKAPDALSDVYQAGLLMYAILYGDFPFNGFIWEELSTAIKEGDVPYPDDAALAGTVPESLKKILGKCLEKEPQKRFKDAAELLKAYEQDVYEANPLATANV